MSDMENAATSVNPLRVRAVYEGVPTDITADEIWITLPNSIEFVLEHSLRPDGSLSALIPLAPDADRVEGRFVVRLGAANVLFLNAESRDHAASVNSLRIRAVYEGVPKDITADEIWITLPNRIEFALRYYHPGGSLCAHIPNEPDAEASAQFVVRPGAANWLFLNAESRLNAERHDREPKKSE